MNADDRTAFDELFRAEYPDIVRAVRPLVGEVGRAEEAAQEAFARLLVHWKRVQRYDKPGAWVRRVAIRVAMKDRRKAPVLDRSDEPTPTGPDEGLRTALRQLPPGQRAALVLHYIEDQPVAEVARTLGCAVATAKVHLHRGRKRLAALLQIDEQETSDVG